MSPRRRVIVADDHPGVLIALTRILAPHVDVVSVATNGEDLLRQVGNLMPDVVVTDISMPRMNGLDACRHIRRDYPAVRVVIVSELIDDHVTETALRLGASAVLRKTQMGEDLRAAVLALPSDAPAQPTTAAYPHWVKFYDDEPSLGRTVAEFLAPGLLERLPALVIATSDHRTVIARELAARGLNIRQLEHDGDLQMVDADEMLARFMVGTEPDPGRFHATVDALIARVCSDRPPCPVRAYGEMVDVLWKRANAEGAIRLEMLWNRIALQAQFSLLCGYAVGNFSKEITAGPTLHTVCEQHNHVIPVEQSA